MSSQPTQNWYTIDKVPLFEKMVNGMLEASDEQLVSLEQAKDKPYILDDAMIVRIIKAHTEQNQNLHYISLQCKRWQEGKLKKEQLKAVKDIELKIEQAKNSNQKVLVLAKYFQNYTINKITEMDSVELALDVFNSKTGCPVEKS